LLVLYTPLGIMPLGSFSLISTKFSSDCYKNNHVRELYWKE